MECKFCGGSEFIGHQETIYGKRPESKAVTLTREEIISKVENEIKFQKTQAKEYESGIFKDEVIFARYDQAAKILEWVLGLLKEPVGHA